MSVDYLKDMADLLVSEFYRPDVSPYLVCDVVEEMSAILFSAPSQERTDKIEDLTIRDLIERAMKRKINQVSGEKS